MPEQTRPPWERCYERTPAEPVELALRLIGFDRDEALSDTWCEHRGLELDQPATGRARMFRGERCRRDASVARAGGRSSRPEMRIGVRILDAAGPFLFLPT